MKRFGVLATAIVAIVVSVGFVSCSDDDDEGGGGAASSGRKLVKFYGGENEWDMDLLYDSKGYLITAKSWDEDYWFTYDYTWYDGSFQECIDDYYNNIYYYAGGLVSSYSDKWETTTYEYDSSNHLLSARNDETTSTLTWEGGQLTRIVQTNKYSTDYDITFTYDGKSCKGFLPLLPFWEPIIYPGIMYDDDDGCGIVNANPGMFGLKITALPNTITLNGEVYEYSYTLDSKSYVTGCTVSVAGDDDETYSFVWE